MNVRLVSTLLASGVFALSAHGQAFCRATTCDPSTGACERDDSSCLITGKPLFWASSCMQVYVQADGSPQDGIDFATAEQSVRRAFDAWLSTDCGSTSPLLDVQVLGPITCGTGEYNSTQHNANIVVFRDDQWPYPASEDTLGFTDLHFNADTGELWDADLEINSFNYRFSVGDPVTDNDLDSMLTHEAGHMLGLAHTLVKDATMFASYTPGTSSLRTLADDDVQAVCAAYAPDRVPSRTSCSPRHGFSDACGAQQPANSATDEGTDQETSSNGGDATSKGCAIVNAPSTGTWGTLWAALGVACGFSLRRSRRHQFVSCEHPTRRR